MSEAGPTMEAYTRTKNSRNDMCYYHTNGPCHTETFALCFGASSSAAAATFSRYQSRRRK